MNKLIHHDISNVIFREVSPCK
jgi:hypothetical protein